MTINFNGGTHEVRLFKEGTQYDRSNLPYFFNSITSVEANIAQGQMASIRVTLEPSFEDAIKILSSGLLGIGATELGRAPQTSTNDKSQSKTVSSQSTTSAVSQPATTDISASEAKDALGQTVAPFLAVKFTYPGQLDNDGSPAETPWFTGPVYTPKIDLSNTNISITLVAQASASFLTWIQGTSVYENKSVLDVITDLAKSVNLDITFDPDDNGTEDKLSQTKMSGVFNEPKMQTIRNILYTNDCYWVTTSGQGKQPQSEIMISSRQSIAESAIQYSFVMFRQIDPANDIIPIFELSLESGTALFLPQGAFGSFQRGVHEGKKKVETLAVNPVVVDGKSLTGNNTTVGTLPKSTPVFGGSAGVVDDSDPELAGSTTPVYSRGTETHNKNDIAASTKRAAMQGVSYRITLPGLPRLQLLRAVQVIIGDFIPGLSSAGWCSQVTHISDGNGWTSHVQFKQSGGSIDKSAASNFSKRGVENLVSDKPSGTNVSSQTLTA